MNVTRDDYVAATNTTYMYTYIHTHNTRARIRIHVKTRVHCRSNTRGKEQPAVRMIRSKRTYLLTNTQPQRYASCIRDS